MHALTLNNLKQVKYYNYIIIMLRSRPSPNSSYYALYCERSRVSGPARAGFVDSLDLNSIEDPCSA